MAALNEHQMVILGGFENNEEAFLSDMHILTVDNNSGFENVAIDLMDNQLALIACKGATSFNLIASRKVITCIEVISDNYSSEIEEEEGLDEDSKERLHPTGRRVLQWNCDPF